MIKNITLVCAVYFFVGGCAASLKSVETGMSTTQVRDAMGKPDRQSCFGNECKWGYDGISRNRVITFRNGRVVAYQ